MMAQISHTRVGAAEIASDIRKSIHSHSLQAFERLPPERTLVETYGVSRRTVRDALMRLEAEGLVEIKRGSGTYVLNQTDPLTGPLNTDIISNTRPLELIDARFALEPHICRLVVLHGQESDFRRLDDLLNEMEQTPEDVDTFSEADAQFHLELAKATNNNLLIWIIHQINTVRYKDRWAYMRNATLNAESISVYHQHHRRILDSLKARQPEEAAHIMKEHLEFARQSLMRAASA